MKTLAVKTFHGAQWREISTAIGRDKKTLLSLAVNLAPFKSTI